MTSAVTGAGGTRMARFVLESLVKDDRVGQADLIISQSRAPVDTQGGTS